MKKFFDKIKDILYASVDYLMMLAIIVAVVLIIGWRLDILFQKDVLASISGNPVEVESQEKDLPKENTNNEVLEDDNELEENLKDRNQENNSNNADLNNKNIEDAKSIQVKIPEGSLPSEIASILKSMNLIEDKDEFVKKAIDLKLDTKLKSGTFSISENSSLEKIIKIISKQESGN